MQENNRTEFKRELTDRFERAVVSFLNYAGGGEIIVGVHDDGSIAGVDDADAVQLKIVDRIRVGSSSQPMREQMMEEFLSKR
jgi:predicted HTH transcriptional regulator